MGPTGPYLSILTLDAAQLKQQIMIKTSWDMASSPIHHKDTLILGVPGSGYETLIAKAAASKLPIRNIGELGYRASSLYPTQWLVNLDEAYSRSTEPWSKPTIWLGYCQNWAALIRLPWHKVKRFQISEAELTNRIKRYRQLHELNSLEPEGREAEVIAGLLLIRRMLEESPLTPIATPDKPGKLLRYSNGVKGQPIMSDALIEDMRKIYWL